MSEPTNDNSIRSQAGADDERLAARMKAIMDHKEARPSKSRSKTAASGNPDWMKSKPKAKQAPAAEAAPVRRAKKKAPVTRPPKNSEESWKLAAEQIARQQEQEQE